MTALKVAAAAGSGIMAGFYVTFSGVVMPGLRRMAPAQGATAMQRINEQAPKTWVPMTLAVTALSVILALKGARTLPDRDGALLLAGTATFLASVVTTFGYHIPRNNRLAALDPASSDGGQLLVHLPDRVDHHEPRSGSDLRGRRGVLRSSHTGPVVRTLGDGPQHSGRNNNHRDTSIETLPGSVCLTFEYVDSRVA
jgi:uncharacterized membrane protein